jgi:hypothetical protein
MPKYPKSARVPPLSVHAENRLPPNLGPLSPAPGQPPHGPGRPLPRARYATPQNGNPPEPVRHSLRRVCLRSARRSTPSRRRTAPPRAREGTRAAQPPAATSQPPARETRRCPTVRPHPPGRRRERVSLGPESCRKAFRRAPEGSVQILLRRRAGPAGRRTANSPRRKRPMTWPASSRQPHALPELGMKPG